MSISRSHRNKFLISKKKRMNFKNIPININNVKVKVLPWIFLVIFLFITTEILALLLTSGENYFRIILGYCITGFFSIFIIYFGWISIQGIVEIITNKSLKLNAAKQSVVCFLVSIKKHKF